MAIAPTLHSMGIASDRSGGLYSFCSCGWVSINRRDVPRWAGVDWHAHLGNARATGNASGNTESDGYPVTSDQEPVT